MSEVEELLRAAGIQLRPGQNAEEIQRLFLLSQEDPKEFERRKRELEAEIVRLEAKQRRQNGPR
jgi:hypothetical protein